VIRAAAAPTEVLSNINGGWLRWGEGREEGDRELSPLKNNN